MHEPLKRERKKEIASVPKQRGRKLARPLYEYKYENKRLRMEVELLRDFLLLAAKDVRTSIKYMVIYRHKDKYSISEIRQFFEVSRHGYYVKKWICRQEI